MFPTWWYRDHLLWIYLRCTLKHRIFDHIPDILTSFRVRTDIITSFPGDRKTRYH